MTLNDNNTFIVVPNLIKLHFNLWGYWFKRIIYFCVYIYK